MAYFDVVWYCNFGNGTTTGYYAVPVRQQNAAVVAGQLCRQFTAPAVGNERVFVCVVAGTTANTTDASWTVSRGSKTNDGTVVWLEVTGVAAVNGDAVNVYSWAQMKATNQPSVGTLIKRNSGTSYQICTTAGTLGANEPTFSDTAGVTTTDNTVVWTSLGPVGNYAAGAAPHARISNACASSWWVGTNTLYVGDNHAETQTVSMTISPSLGSGTYMSRILCHNHAGSYPPGGADLMSGAVVSTTGASSITIAPGSGGIYIYGIAFQAGVGSAGNAQLALTSVSGWVYFDHCILKVAATGSSSYITLGAGTASAFLFNSTQLSFAGGAQTIYFLMLGQVIWQNTAPLLVPGSASPTALFTPNANGYITNVVFEAVDMSSMSGNFYSPGSSFSEGTFLIKDCKLNPSTAAQNPGFFGQTVQFVRSG